MSWPPREGNSTSISISPWGMIVSQIVQASPVLRPPQNVLGRSRGIVPRQWRRVRALEAAVRRASPASEDRPAS